jgi:hypothetical protein
MSDDQLTRIEEKLDGVVAGQASLQTRMGNVETRMAKVEVTIEGMRDDIKQIAEGHAAMQEGFTRSTATVIAHVDRKIEPLERAVRALFGSRS